MTLVRADPAAERREYNIYRSICDNMNMSYMLNICKCSRLFLWYWHRPSGCIRCHRTAKALQARDCRRGKRKFKTKSGKRYMPCLWYAPKIVSSTWNERIYVYYDMSSAYLCAPALLSCEFKKAARETACHDAAWPLGRASAALLGLETHLGSSMIFAWLPCWRSAQGFF